jgi:ADP-dependent NAD(P)H-hydrate dehydratase
MTQAITPALLRHWQLPEPGDSKHSRGHVLVVGGAAGTPGAVLLAGLAALRVGAGVLAMAVPDAVAIPLAVAVPESGVCPWTITADGLDRASRDRLANRIEQSDAVAVGPGIDDPAVAVELVTAVAELTAPDVPVVLDAYALGALHRAGAAAERLAGRLVLTPNHSEAARLLEIDVDQLPADDLEVAAELSNRWQAVVSYQGAVASQGQPPRAPSTGDAGLGTSGSGDVLAGAVAGLLARGAAVDQAACWASFLHAAAGDRLAARVGRLGYLARELLDEVPLVLAELSS